MSKAAEFRAAPTTGSAVRTSGAQILLVGYQDQGNLGLGYLAAVLIARGYAVEVVDFRRGPRAVLDAARENKPLVIGLSIIFQYYLPRFAALAAYLREQGVESHLTAGGHYPTLRYEDTLREIPELDSVVLFEGELTLLEVVATLADGRDWRATPGIAWQGPDGPVRTPLRPLVANLDELPFPHRPLEADSVLGRKIRPILATRGCPRHCAFCSIREFYARAPGKDVRRRTPVNVVNEMRELHEDEKVRIFLFQDDDFPAYGAAGSRWVRRFIAELAEQRLLGRVIWKISCRVDEVEPELFAEMRSAGLYLVYLGIESGTDDGLAALNKQVRVEDNLSAVGMLKRLGLSFGYGFMLFDPSSTFYSVRANVAFLRSIIGDGSSAVVFCKMLPYAGTPIEATLTAEGRLIGSIVRPDYRFIDSRLDEYYEQLNALAAPWLNGPDALSHTLNVLAHESVVMQRLFNGLGGLDSYRLWLRETTRKSNECMLGAIEASLDNFERFGDLGLDQDALAKWSCATLEKCIERRDEFVSRNQEQMLDVLTSDAA
jgi:radical SAM superfamily enzyme YgiQ (UPF0313 family)